MNSPIADLTYRNYDGPLEKPYHRWWAIAVMSMRLSIKKKGFWIWSALSAYWYLVLMAIFYFVNSFGDIAGANAAGQNPFLASIKWKDQFVHAFSISQLLLFVIALLIGIGTIANDNRANALLVYLSKPCSKRDYIAGKWLGIFLPIAAVVFVPGLIFYLYCALSFRQYGILADPWLMPKFALVALVPAAFHASVCLAISSLFDQGRMAGATYAGLYFLGLFFTKAMQVVYAVRSQESQEGPPAFVGWLYYCSIDGIQIALSKIILGTNGSPLLDFPQGPGRRGGRAEGLSLIPAPPSLPFVAAFLAICVVAIVIAWRRVRAVEVV